MENSFYPFIDFLSETNIIPNNEPLPLYREIAWDFKEDMPIVENNEFKIVEMNEAISVWIYHAIKTSRYIYSIYSWDFGCEIDTLLGQNYTTSHIKTEVTRYITEALEINPYIISIEKIIVDFDGEILNVDVRVITVYEELEVNFVV